MMFSDKKPEHPLQIGAIDPHCDVIGVLEGTLLFWSFKNLKAS